MQGKFSPLNAANYTKSLRLQSSAAVQSIMAQSNKTVLVLDGQAEANGAARFFVSREDEVCGRAGRRKTWLP